MDPQQELFTELLIELRKTKYDVYDSFLPGKGVKYPFIYVADNILVDNPNKSAVFGTVSQTINVWHNNPRQRGTVSKMLLDIKTICRKIEHTKNFNWMVTDVNQRILPDNTTNKPLIHGILTVDFLFS